MRTLADTEKQAVLTAFQECGYRVTETSEGLGISEQTLYRKLAGWGIASPQRMKFPDLNKKIKFLLASVTGVE